MDDRRFDALTRSLATGFSRRKALKALLGGAVLGGAAATHLDQASAQVGTICAVGQFVCNNECCDNANNCCGGTTCCPSSQCNQGNGVCCDSGEFACGTGDNSCCDTQTEKCCDGVCISAGDCCPSLPDCTEACTECVDGSCQPVVCDDPCEACIDTTCQPIFCDGPCQECVGGTCQSSCTGNQHCCEAAPAPYCAECCGPGECDDCWACVTGICEQEGFLCNGECCGLQSNCCGGTTCCPPNFCNQTTGTCCGETQFPCGTGDNACCDIGDNCCGGTTCCPSGQCNQQTGTCCSETEFFCGTGDNACCDTATEKCCDGVCIDRNLCCPSLPDCAGDQVCCQGVCQECCTNDDCDKCEICVDGGACRPLQCEDACHYCDPDVDACVPYCPEDQHCCVSGPTGDTTVTCVDGSECCDDSQCDACESCVNGYCQADALPCPEGEVSCCNGDELFCTQCCHDSDCDTCHLCHQGRCVPCEAGGLICCDDTCVDQKECCTPFGDECGLLEVTSAGGDWPSQLDCCDGLVCCWSHDGSVCAECCTDHECPKGSICCAGQCREIECCVDDVLIGLDPNRRCPDGCSCFEGYCDCHCHHDKDCAWGACCCPDGTCSDDCCATGCASDKDCGYGTCCCHDGSCSAHCCKTPPPSTLPNTGSGRESGRGSSALGTAALGALAAYYAARKLREQQPDEATTEE